MELFEIATVLPIVVICYGLGLGLKNIKQIADSWIPFILCITGGIIAVPAMHIMNDFPANDVITAFAVGVASGLASIGVNQIYKQTKKGK